MKRAFDIVVSGAGLVVLSPVFAAISAAIVVDSGRPVLFRQERVGRNGRTFEILKFRTMTTSAAGGPQVTAAGDARITRVGHFLRFTKLDELPQLVNVLRGELSLVGPRPEVPKYVALWPAADRELILSVRPGITDPASQKYRREAELLAVQDDPERFYREVVLPDKVAMYADYARNRSGMVDLRLLMATLHAVVVR